MFCLVSSSMYADLPHFLGLPCAVSHSLQPILMGSMYIDMSSILVILHKRDMFELNYIPWSPSVEVSENCHLSHDIKCTLRGLRAILKLTSTLVAQMII